MIDPNAAGNKKTTNLPVSTSVGTLIEEIAKVSGYVASSINITYNKQVGPEIEEVIYTTIKILPE